MIVNTNLPRIGRIEADAEPRPAAPARCVCVVKRERECLCTQAQRTRDLPAGGLDLHAPDLLRALLFTAARRESLLVAPQLIDLRSHLHSEPAIVSQRDPA